MLPDGHIHKLRIGRLVRSMREAPLTLTTLAALAPPELEIDFELVDGSIDRIPAERPFDLVAISALTGTAPQAYAWAHHFRARGIPVVLGGVHVTLMPEEAAGHADSIVTGPAEEAWPALLRDFSRGRMKRVYKGCASSANSLAGLPTPRRDLQRRSGYMAPHTVMATRGCRNACEFCTVPGIWSGYAKRPVGEVIDDIKSTGGRLIAFNDVNLVADVDYAKELFTAMAPLKLRWGGLATTRVATDPELLDVMARSGCIYLLIGFESVSQPALGEVRKGGNRATEYEAVVGALHALNISVQGCFMFGFDHDDTSVFDATVQRVFELGIDIPRYSILTPYPGTGLYDRLSAEGRILTRNWANYDTMHVVFEPARMSPTELHNGFKRAYEETFKLRHIARRTLSFSAKAAINFVGNLAYKRFVRELRRSPRHARPFMGTADSPASWNSVPEEDTSSCHM